MADEASITIVARMRDEASQKMKVMGQNVQQTAFSMQAFQQTLTATGGALTAVGSLMNMVGGEAGKTAAIFVTTAGAILSTTGAILSALPMIRSLTTTLRGLAIVQAVVAALSGPIGWGKLAIGLGLAAGATAGIIALTRAGRGGADTGGAQVVNFNSQAFTGSQQDARKFSRQMQTISREDTRLGR
jgi:predicted aconitase with swiveling domain